MNNSRGLERWMAYFFASMRRQPRARKYQYVVNVPQIRQLKLQNTGKQLASNKGKIEISVNMNKDIFKIDVSQIQKLLVEDVRYTDNATFRLRNNKQDLDGKPISNWEILASMLSNPIDPKYLERRYNDEGLINIPFRFKHTIQMQVDNPDGTSASFNRVLWPDPIFSLSCRGIGLTPEMYKQLSNKNTKIINPANDGVLPIYEVNFIPKGYNVIGLFPQFIPQHKSIFQDIDFYSASIKARACLGKQNEIVKKLITTDYKDNETETETSELFLSSKDSNIHNSRNTLEKLLDMANYDSKLWSTSIMTNKSCPGDIFRSALMAKNVNRTALRKEYMKNYVLFNFISLNLRIQEYLNSHQNPNLGSEIQWKPWDRFIWNEFQKLESNMMKENTIEQLQELRYKFNNFLYRLFEYNCLVTAEMKVQGKKFFENNENNDISRAMEVSLLSKTILTQCKEISTFYPGLALYIKKVFATANIDIVHKMPVIEDPKIQEIGEVIFNIIKEMIIFESEHIYSDKFNSHRRMVSEQSSPLTDWKIVILHKKPLLNRYAEVIKYQSRIFTQFLTNLGDIDKIRYSKCICKTMIDENTFIYLYKMSREKRSSLSDIVADIMKTKKLELQEYEMKMH